MTPTPEEIEFLFRIAGAPGATGLGHFRPVREVPCTESFIRIQAACSSPSKFSKWLGQWRPDLVVVWEAACVDAALQGKGVRSR